jgi:hypothetical protein
MRSTRSSHECFRLHREYFRLQHRLDFGRFFTLVNSSVIRFNERRLNAGKTSSGDCPIVCSSSLKMGLANPVTTHQMRARVKATNAWFRLCSSARLELGNPAPNGGLDREHLTLELRLGGRTYQSSGRSGWFEDEMLDVQGQLPPGTYLRACITCAYSDYSPIGHGLFGGMACFRDNKAEYLAVRSKADLFRIWGTMTEFVQETYLCPEFERRQPGTGYRG